MPLVLGKNPALLELQPLSQEVDANQPPVIKTYSPDVEKWRRQVWDEMPPQLRQRPDAATLLDKSLYVMEGESGGGENKPGDGGAAWGLYQSHHIPAGSDATTQIKDMWRLVSNNPDSWSDWGQNALYEGKPFGALGRNPYPGDSGGGSGSAIGNSIGQQFSQPQQQKPTINYTKPQQLPDFNTDTQGFPAVQQPDYSGIDTQGLPAIESAPLPNTPNLRGINPNQGGFRDEQYNPANVEPGANANTLGPVAAAANWATSSIPALETAKDQLGTGLDKLGANNLIGLPSIKMGGGGAISTDGAALPIGETIAEQFPTTPLGVGLTTAPFAGDIKAGAEAAGARVAPKLRLVTKDFIPETTGFHAGIPTSGGNLQNEVKLAAARKQYQDLIAQGFTDEQIAATFGQQAVDMGKNGIDTAAQNTARLDQEQAAKGAAASRTTNRLKAEQGIEGTAPPEIQAEAKRAAAQAPEKLPAQKPNVLATEETANEMAAARERVRNPQQEQGQPKTEQAGAGDAMQEQQQAAGGGAEEYKGKSPSSSENPEGVTEHRTADEIAFDNSRTAAMNARARDLGVAPEDLPFKERQQITVDLIRALDKTTSSKSAEEVLTAAQRRADLKAQRTASPQDVARWKERIADAERAANQPSRLPTQAELAEISGNTHYTSPTDNPNAGQLELGGQGGQLGLSEGNPNAGGPIGPSDQTQVPRFDAASTVERARLSTEYAGRAAQPQMSAAEFQQAREQLITANRSGMRYPADWDIDKINNYRSLEQGLKEPTFQGEGSSILPPKKPGVNEQGSFPEFNPAPGKPETAVHRAYREVRDLFNAPISFLTYGHEPVFRQGVGFALTHPSTAKEALTNLVRVVKDPEAWQSLNKGLNSQPFTKAAMDAGFFHEGENTLSETFVNRVLNKIPGMENSRQSARAYLTTLRKAGYEEEAQRLWQMGVRDPAEYKSVWNTISDVTGHGLHRGESISVGGFSPAFSPGAMVGRFRSLLDPFTQAGSFNPLKPGARSIAMRNLIGIGGMTLTLDGIAKASGADLKWNLLTTPLGKIEIGPSTIDSTAGLQSIVKSGAQMADALASGNLKKAADSAISYARGQLGPSSDTVIDTYFGQDWKGADFNLIDRSTMSPANKESLFRKMFEPIAAASIQDAIQAHGPKGLLIGAPSAGAMSVETNTLKAARDKGAEELGLNRPYADLLQSEKDRVDALPAVKDEAGAPSALKQGSLDIKAKYDTQENSAIDQFKQNKLAALPDGTPVQNLPDAWMKLGLERRAATEQYQKEHGEEFNNIPQSDYKRVTEPYYAEQNFVKNPDGTIDFDATAAKRLDYINSLSDKPNGSGPSDRAIMQDAIHRIEGNKSEAHQRYDKYIAERKQAGYFDIKPDDPKANEKKLELDKKNPLQDALNWYWKGGTPDSTRTPKLNTTAGVDIALQLAPNRPVDFAGLSRPINQSPQTQAAWQEFGPRIDAYFNKAVPEYKEQVAKEKFGSVPGFKGFDSLDGKMQQTVVNDILKRVRDGAPDLEAALQFFGHTKDANGMYVVSPKAGVELQKMLQKYGNTPPQPNTVFAVRQ